MAAGHPHQPGEPALRSLEGASPLLDPALWCRQLQQACQLEADGGFSNRLGRRERFGSFLERGLAAPPPRLGDADRQAIAELQGQLCPYETLEPASRSRRLARLRRLLHAILERQRPPSGPAAPPPLRLLASPRPGPAPAGLRPDAPLSAVSGIGPATATRLAALGLLTVADLLQHLPRDYLDYAHRVRIDGLRPGATATIVARVRRCHAYRSRRNPNLSILDLQLEDSTGRVSVTRFLAGRRNASAAWLQSQQRQFPPGATVAVSGLVKEGPRGMGFRDPLIELLEGPNAPVRSSRIGRLVPVYALTEGLGAERLRRAVEAVLPVTDRWPERIDADLREQLGLPGRGAALRQLHAPTSREALRRARRSLVFEEFLLLQLGLGRRRRRSRQGAVPPPPTGEGEAGLLQRFLEQLPFPLTGAQRRVLGEIRADLARPEPMARLLQGDVGSGKTLVAVAALLLAIEAGWQGALMAPTEVLAEQHFRRLADGLARLHVSCGLLTGSTPARRRRRLLEDLANGQVSLLVGTHALLEDPVAFPRLGLVVVDEQHRFGVRQRDRLLAKGLQPHLLTMTATPIPRTLALARHGDLDLSQIDELPPGRTPVRTRLLRGGERQRAWSLVREEVARGQRAYVVLPLVEESETLDLRSAVEEHARLRDSVFPDLAVGLLHGRLAAHEKLGAINAFAAGEIQVLVATTVVEVGVDVPEASVMVIDHAERFGLAQLHQLRGRVGRGAAVSHCLLIEASGSATARQRLEILARSSDGFEIAEMDLRLRGPGQVLGTRQSGLPDLALASLSEDGDLLERARDVARDLLERDPDLRQHPRLAGALTAVDGRRGDPGRLN